MQLRRNPPPRPSNSNHLYLPTESVLSIGGPEIAAEALKAGLVDEVHLRVCPVMVGGGNKFWPGWAAADVELNGERHFRDGDLFVRYATKSSVDEM